MVLGVIRTLLSGYETDIPSCFPGSIVLSEAGMRFLFRWAFRLILLAVVLAVALVLLKDTLLKSYAEHRIQTQTGLDAKIERLQAGLFSPTLTIENLKLYNAAEFGGSPLLDLPELHLEFESSRLALRKLHFKLVRLRLNELNIMESKNGRTNITGFVGELQKVSSTHDNNSLAADFQFAGIDVLNLTMGMVRYSSLKQPGKDMDVQLGLKNEILTHIKTLPELSELILNILFKRGITITSQGDRTSITVGPKHERTSVTNKTRSGLAPPRTEGARKK